MRLLPPSPLPTILLATVTTTLAQAQPPLLNDVQPQPQPQHQELPPDLVAVKGRPTAIRKMSFDVGQKFFPGVDMEFSSNSSSSAADNSELAKRPQQGGQHRRHTDMPPPRAVEIDRVAQEEEEFGKPYGPVLWAREELERRDKIAHIVGGTGVELGFRPAFAVHHNPDTPPNEDEGQNDYDLRDRALAQLENRQFACPPGTSSCFDIGFGGYCCGTGETCFKVPDTGSGPIGCCPAGAVCGGELGDCASGAEQCPGELGGGCCLLGYECREDGCVAPGVIVTVTQIFTRPSTTITSTTTSTFTSSPPPPSTTTSPATTSPPSTDSTPTTATANPPTRPTGTDCPTGFYPCLATAGGGCCRTGRDCATTSCPPLTYTAIVTNGVTISVPVDEDGDVINASGFGQDEGDCAGGWYVCGDEGGEKKGCCPDGYRCGLVSCTATVDVEAEGTVGKELPVPSAAAPTKEGGAISERVGMGMVMTVVGVMTGVVCWAV